MITHTLKTLLEMPVDELRVMVAECANKMRWSYALPIKVIHCDVPDYESDLNAITILEDGLTDQLEKVNYINKLRSVIGTTKLKNLADCLIVSDFDLLTATAHHRAVAYVAVKLKI